MEDNSGTALSKVIINGQEFDESEVSELIETGRKTREYEQKWNTKLDNVWPDYGRKSDLLRIKEGELETAQKELNEFRTKKQEGIETPADVKDAKEAARKLGITLNEDLEQAGFIKKSDLDKYFDEKDQKKRATDTVLAEADTLVKEINGSDGRPKFNKRAILAYASAYGLPLKEAYESMHEDDLKVWKDTQIQAQRAKGLKTLKGSSEKSPQSTRINDDNLKAALGEALWGGKNEE